MIIAVLMTSFLRGIFHSKFYCKSTFVFLFFFSLTKKKNKTSVKKIRSGNIRFIFFRFFIYLFTLISVFTVSKDLPFVSLIKSKMYIEPKALNATKTSKHPCRSITSNKIGKYFVQKNDIRFTLIAQITVPTVRTCKCC